MPATLNIDQIISSQLVVSTTDSLFSPSIRESVLRRFHSLIQNPPFHRISFACLPYLTTSHQIPNLPPNRSFPSQKDTPASNQPLPTKKPQTSSSPKEKEKRKKKERNGIRPRLRRRPSQSGLQHAYWLVRNQSWRLWVSLSDFCAIF